MRAMQRHAHTPATPTRPLPILIGMILLSSCGGTTTTPPPPPPPPPLALAPATTSGDFQSGFVGGQLPQQLRVPATRNGTASPGESITWTTTSGQLVGAVSTDADGIASTNRPGSPEGLNWRLHP